jgi:hypothetical protein
MEQKELEIHIAQELASLRAKYKMEVVQTWQDKLLESLKDEENPGMLVDTLSKLLDEPPKKDVEKPIKLSNPDKLARDYALLSGDSVNIKYVDEDKSQYYYKYKIRTRPLSSGKMFIRKKKLDGRVYIEFHHDNGGSESRNYEMDEFTDFQKFMELIINVIRKF